MKRLYLILLIIPFILSCSSDEDDYIPYDFEGTWYSSEYGNYLAFKKGEYWSYYIDLDNKKPVGEKGTYTTNGTNEIVTNDRGVFLYRTYTGSYEQKFLELEYYSGKKETLRFRSKDIIHW